MVMIMREHVAMYNGLQTKIREHAPFIFYVPNSARSLILVATVAAESSNLYIYYVNIV